MTVHRLTPAQYGTPAHRTIHRLTGRYTSSQNGTPAYRVITVDPKAGLPICRFQRVNEFHSLLRGKENENAISNRTERVMVKAMCGQRIVDRKTEEQMNMLGLKETTIFEVLHRLVIG